MQCSDNKCLCLPEKLIKQIIKQKKVVVDLDLQGIQIQHIQNLMLVKDSLQYLYLAKNRIHQLNQIDLLSKLRVLDLSQNDLTSLQQITNLLHLEHLLVGFNQVKAFDLPIQTLPSLTTLDLSYNQLQNIEDIVSQIKDQSVNSISLIGNQLQQYENKLIQCVKSIIIVDGRPIRNVDLRQSVELRRIIHLQEQQLKQNTSEPEVLQKWRQALFKEMVVRKELLLLYRGSLHSIKIQFNKRLDIYQNQTNKIIQELGIKINKSRNTILRVLQEFRNQSQLNSTTLQRISYSLQSLIGQTEFTARVDESLILNYVRVIKTTLDETKRQKQEAVLTCDIYRQESEYVKEQLQQLQGDFEGYKRDSERKENLYRSQDMEKSRVLGELKQEIKSLQEDKLKCQLQLKEERSHDELEVFQLRQKYEQEIQVLKQDILIYQQKLRSQAEEFKSRYDRQQQKYDERLVDQEQEFSKYYSEVKQEYEVKLTQKKKLEDKQQQDIMQYKQQVSELQIKLQTIEFDREQDNIQRIQEKHILEQSYTNSLQELKLSMERRVLEQTKRLEEDKLLQIQEVVQKYEKEKSDLFRVQEDTNLRQLNELESVIDDERQQKKKLQQQNVDLTNIIELKNEMIRQLQLNNAELKTQVKQQPITKHQQQDNKQQDDSNQKKSQTLKMMQELERKAFSMVREDSD